MCKYQENNDNSIAEDDFWNVIDETEPSWKYFESHSQLIAFDINYKKTKT